MKTLSYCYRQLCREVDLTEEERALCLKLLRELCTNTAKYRLAWQIRQDFIALWFVSAGRFPELVELSSRQAVNCYLNNLLPFQLSEQERQLLWT